MLLLSTTTRSIIPQQQIKSKTTSCSFSKKSIQKRRNYFIQTRKSNYLSNQLSRHSDNSFQFLNFTRSYARHRRRTRTETREQEEEQWNSELTKTEQNEVRGVDKERYEEPAYDADEMDQTSESAMTPGVRKHISTVYRTMMGAMGLTAVGSVIGMAVPGLSMVGLIGGFAAILGIMFTSRDKVRLRENLLYGFGLLEGMAIAPLLAASAPGVIFAAAFGTAAIFGGFTLAALRSKRSTTLMMQGPLLGGLILVFGAGILHLVLPFFGVVNPAIFAALYNINLYLGLGIFSLFITYDTKRMIEEARAGNTDHVSDALSMFLNLINIFIRLLSIFDRR